jgi:hypothetical protein
VNARIFDELTTEWHDDEHRIKDWFGHHTQPDTPAATHSPTIAVQATPAPNPPQNTKEPAVSVPDAVTALKANLEAAASALTTALDEDVPGLASIGAQIDNSRLIQAAVAADAVAPANILEAHAATLEALTAAFTPPAPVPAADQPAA